MTHFPFEINHGLLDYLFKSDIKNGIYPILEPNLYMPLFLVGIFVVIISSYLLGSINTSIIVSRLVYHDDVRKHGSGNAGMTNMLRTYGKGAAGLTLIGDMMKTVIAIAIAGFLFGFKYLGGVSTEGGVCYVAGLFVVIGHVFPCFYKFKGGKGVLATATMALILSPIPFLLLLLIFIGIVAASRYVSLGSVTVAVLYPVVLDGYFRIVFSKTDISTPGLASLSAITLAILIVWCHRENLKRISEKRENKISFGKKHEPEDIKDEGDNE